jgi:hypothetical protein
MDVRETLTSRRTRIGFLLFALLTYGGLMAYGALADQPAAFALAKVHIGAVLVIGVGFAAAIQDIRADLLTLAGVGYFVAGLAIAYSGLATLSLVPQVALFAPAGDIAIVVALLAYLYQRHFSESEDPPAETATEEAGD